MTPNKLPPLPELIHSWRKSAHDYRYVAEPSQTDRAEELEAAADELENALRQSQSLPAGAVAGVTDDMITRAMHAYMDEEIRVFGEVRTPNNGARRGAMRCALEQALQADAREKVGGPDWKTIAEVATETCDDYKRIVDDKIANHDLLVSNLKSALGAHYDEEAGVVCSVAFLAAKVATHPAQASEAVSDVVMSKAWRNQYVNERTQHHRRIDEPYEIARAKAESEAIAFEDEFRELMAKRATSSQETASE